MGFVRSKFGYWFSFVFVLFAQTAFLSSVSHAQISCQNVYQDRKSLHKSSKDHSEVFQSYKNIQTKLERALRNASPEVRQEALDTLAAVEFYDHDTLLSQLINNLMSINPRKLEVANLWDQQKGTNILAHIFGERPGAPFAGFKAARAYLESNDHELTPDLLQRIHELVMQDRVENIDPESLGKWRSVSVVGNVKNRFMISSAAKEAFENNNYLSFVESAKGHIDLTNIEGLRYWGSKSYSDGPPEMAKYDKSLYEGVLYYPSVKRLKPELLELVKNIDIELYERIKANLDAGKLPDAASEAQFIEALTRERFQRFNKDRAELGPIIIGQNEMTYIQLVSDFQSDLVAIHPMLNGNGRTTRLLLNYLLRKEGLPEARFLNTFADLESSKSSWAQEVADGMRSFANLKNDIADRINLGLPISRSPYLLHPTLPEKYQVKTYSQAKNTWSEAQTVWSSGPDQFNAFVQGLILTNPKLKDEILRFPEDTLQILTNMYWDFQKSKSVMFIHRKDGEFKTQLKLIDPDFIDLFGKVTVNSMDLYRYKLSRWYEADTLVWRGLSDQRSELSDNDLIRYFTQVSHHMASNSVLRSVRSQEDLRQAMIRDFLTYNTELLNGKLVQMADDHHKTGPRYGQSYGYSTSKREVVGKAFAMGAMVVGEYGGHKSPELQAKLKSRINIASYKSVKDVDLGRLRSFAPDFRYTYGRQAEVMGIGGTDPDAIVLIQRINAEGEVIHTFYRNPENPAEILKIEGRFVPGETVLDPRSILEIIELK